RGSSPWGFFQERTEVVFIPRQSSPVDVLSWPATPPASRSHGMVSQVHAEAPGKPQRGSRCLFIWPDRGLPDRRKSRPQKAARHEQTLTRPVKTTWHAA